VPFTEKLQNELQAYPQKSRSQLPSYATQYQYQYQPAYNASGAVLTIIAVAGMLCIVAAVATIGAPVITIGGISAGGVIALFEVLTMLTPLPA